MTLIRLILEELTYRKWNFLLGLASVTVAVGFLVGALVLLKLDDIHTERILAQKQQAVTEAGAAMEDAMRKIMKGLGFNVIILPKDQDLGEMHLEGSLTSTMPESYVDRLASSKIVTVNHLLPTVIKKLDWPEKNIQVVVYGTRGEVPLLHKDPKKPLLDAVPRGSMIVGHEIGRKLSLAKDAKVTFRGEPFTVLKVHGERGSIDDNTIWINLRQAQEMLGMENLIHAIQALECHCAGDRITQIRNEIGAILPGTQVIERGKPALARAEARSKAKTNAVETLKMEVVSRANLKAQRERFTALLVPVVLVGAAAWVAFLAFGNVRQRRSEIGILRAMGFRATQILSIFLGKSLLMGLGGAVLGILGGWFTGQALAVEPETAATAAAAATQAAGTGLEGSMIMIALAVALGLSILASWIPAVLAARQDPALILHAD